MAHVSLRVILFSIFALIVAWKMISTDFILEG